MNKLLTYTLLTVLLGLAATAEAEPPYYMQSIPGASCAPANWLEPDDLYLYEDRALANTGKKTGEYFVAKCAISEFADKMRAIEVRVRFSDHESRRPICLTYDVLGNKVHQAEAEHSGSEWVYYFSMDELDDDVRLDEQISLTIYCIQPADMRLELVNVVWKRL